MTPIRLAFLGVGDVAQRDYLPELHRLAGRVEIAAVCGRTPERTRAVAEQYQAGAWYTDYDQMLAEAAVDAVINLTPIQSHAATTLAALEAGKHVYTEKPVAGSAADARRLQAAAQQHQRKLVCAPCVMLFPQVRYAQTLLAKNALGEIYLARAVIHMGVPPWQGYASDPSPFFAKGGGPAVDMGVYPLHALTGLLGPAQRVSAMASRTRASFVPVDGPVAGQTVPVEVDDNWQITLDLGGARLATLDANNCAHTTHAPHLEIFGLKGTLALNLLDVSAPVKLQPAGGDWTEVALPRTGRAAGPDHLLGIEHLVDCIELDRDPVLSVEHALHVVEIIEQAERSAQTGQVWRIASTLAQAA
jgi:predicted dehydrogenase